MWHQRWTWRDRTLGGPREHWHRLARFNLVNGILSMTGQLVFTKLYAEMLSLHYAWANILAIASCSVITFAINDRLVFWADKPPRFPRMLPCSSDVQE